MARPEVRGEYTPDGKPYQGTLIREIRQSAHQTIKSFATKVGLHPASLSRVELNTARVGDEVLVRIARALDVPVEDLATAPIHPKLGMLKSPRRTLSLCSIGDQINSMIAGAHLSDNYRNLAEQLILDTSKAIIIHLGVSKEN